MVFPERVFAAIVPWLILAATTIFTLQPVMAKHIPGPRRVDEKTCPVLLLGGGAYFGGALGIVLLPVLGLTLIVPVIIAPPLNGRQSRFSLPRVSPAASPVLACPMLMWVHRTVVLFIGNASADEMLFPGRRHGHSSTELRQGGDLK